MLATPHPPPIPHNTSLPRPFPPYLLSASPALPPSPQGRSWPFEETLSLDEFRAYFLSHHAFVVRSKPSAAGRSGEVLGIFYVKPNFPGRCSHVCNGGFITREESRNNGVGTVMALAFLRLARDLGYQASYFNLVRI